MKATASHNRESLKAAKEERGEWGLEECVGLRRQAERAFLARRLGGEKNLRQVGLC